MSAPTKPPRRPAPAPAPAAAALADLTTPKKPARRSVRQQTPAAVDAPPLVLTPEERRLVMLYRATVDRWREMTLDMSEYYAKRHPRHAKPSLRLVAGGAG